MSVDGLKVQSLIFNMSMDGHCFFTVNSLPNLDHIENFAWSMAAIHQVEHAFFDNDRKHLISFIPRTLSAEPDLRNMEIGYLLGALFNNITRARSISNWRDVLALETLLFIVRYLPCPESVLLQFSSKDVHPTILPKIIATRPGLTQKVVLFLLELDEPSITETLATNSHLDDSWRVMAGLKVNP